MNRHTGLREDGLPHVSQSVMDVLSTVQGERVMRPTYGSRLLESVADAGNAQGKALLLGRVADAVDAWEGDRLELRRVQAEMRDPGHVQVYVEGSTDEERFELTEEIRPDDRWSAYDIVHRDMEGSYLSVGALLDAILPLFAGVVVTDPPPRWPAATARQAPTTGQLNAAPMARSAAACEYRGRSLQEVCEEIMHVLRSAIAVERTGYDFLYWYQPEYKTRDAAWLQANFGRTDILNSNQIAVWFGEQEWFDIQKAAADYATQFAEPIALFARRASNDPYDRDNHVDWSLDLVLCIGEMLLNETALFPWAADYDTVQRQGVLSDGTYLSDFVSREQPPYV